jgi:hypothetical protein
MLVFKIISSVALPAQHFYAHSQNCKKQLLALQCQSTGCKVTPHEVKDAHYAWNCNNRRLKAKFFSPTF